MNNLTIGASVTSCEINFEEHDFILMEVDTEEQCFGITFKVQCTKCGDQRIRRRRLTNDMR